MINPDQEAGEQWILRFFDRKSLDFSIPEINLFEFGRRKCISAKARFAFLIVLVKECGRTTCSSERPASSRVLLNLGKGDACENCMLLWGLGADLSQKKVLFWKMLTSFLSRSDLQNVCVTRCKNICAAI